MEFTVDVILGMFSQFGFAALVGVGVWWFVRSVWPWVAERDEQERERRYMLAQNSTTTQEAMALALASVAESLANPIKVSIVGETEAPGPPGASSINKPH